MSSDCIKCWDTPCTCGWDYRNWSADKLKEQIDILQKVKQFKEYNPQYEYSKYSFELQTEGDNKLYNYLNGR
jgi:hypothetical protein